MYFHIQQAITGWHQFAIIGQDAPPPGPQPGLMEALLGNPMSFMLLVMMLFFLIVVLPQQRQMKRQQKELADALNAIKKNDRIVTTGGIHGTIIQTDDATVTIRIDENSGARMTINREAIAKVVTGDTKEKDSNS